MSSKAWESGFAARQDEATAQGFADCEALVVAMLASRADCLDAAPGLPAGASSARSPQNNRAPAPEGVP